MTSSAVEAFYRRYIDVINQGHASDLSEFVPDNLLYNSELLTRFQYKNLIIQSQQAAPDIYFKVALLLTTETHIAARIDFHCTPIHTFLGFSPTGKAVSFSEHVFYRLSRKKISEVWSLIDLPSVEAQLNS